MTIREATAADAAQIAALSAQLGYEASAAATAGRIMAINASTSDIALVATDEERIVGWIHTFYTLRLESDAFCEIGGLVTDAAYRGQGIGKLLIAAIRPWCAERNCTKIKVRSNVIRHDAHNFYRHLGFADIKEQAIFELKL